MNKREKNNIILNKIKTIKKVIKEEKQKKILYFKLKYSLKKVILYQETYKEKRKKRTKERKI